ncbi:MAG: autotransporter-associated beta strand repeat-containing protein, partial [Bacteroidales bacterium]|nr:autotransporter-associated beta strand repeat-containing protein [Bacteroidales bacterium]
MKIIIIIAICLSLIGITSVVAQRQMEAINHGLIAIKTSSGVYVSWRVLADEYDGASYNLYRDGTKITSSPVSTKSNVTDANGTLGSVYEVKTVINGTETSMGDSAQVWENSYLDIPVRPIDGVYSTYELNDASIGDLDGDGDYEIVVKRLVLNNVASNTDYHYLEAYEMDGTFMWAINMGPNIFNKVEFNFLVWDLDGDGKAEVTLRTSEGFTDAAGNQIGDINGDGKTNYRYSISSIGYRQEGPDFLSVIDGQTGVEITRATYIPRIRVSDWGRNDGGHRSTKCMYTAAYLDGKHPSIVISRGIYERIAMAAWDFDGTSLTQRWYFDSNTSGNGDYAQQGFHNLTLGDVDSDGRDEIMYGSMCIDDNGKGLYSTKLGHGDAQHLTDINPDRKGLEYFGCLENSAGGNLRDAGTGEVLFYKNIGRDMGRCGCADITDKYPGMEMWGPSGFPFLSATGDIITDLPAPGSMNFFIWWDGDASREILDHAWNSDHGVGTITKYNNGQNTRLLTATGTLSNNWTKGTPSLSAEMLGDWRDDVLWRTNDNSALRIYMTTKPTDLRIYTLMQDPQYRAAIGWQQNSYNQPPHTSFFIGNDMDSIPPSPIMLRGQKVWESGQWNTSSSSWLESGTSQAFVDGDKVLFDISGSSPVVINEDVSPRDIRVIAPQDFTLEGSGDIQGNTNLTKSGKGALYLNSDNSYSGLTRVWSGELYLNGTLSQSKVLVKRFATLGGGGAINAGAIIEKYAKLSVGSPLQMIDTLTIGEALVMNDASEIDLDLSITPEANNDLVTINGDWNILGKTTININAYDAELSPGSYLLLSVSGALNGSLDNIEFKGASQWPSQLQWSNGELRLVVSDTRLSDSIVWNGTVNNQWDMFNTLNWLNDGAEDYFLGNDIVTFNNEAKSKMVNITGNFTVNTMNINATSTYFFVGNGSINGEGQIIKNGSGNATLSTTNSHTGGNIINSGKLIINDITDEKYPCPLGIADNTTNVTINSGTLYIAKNTTISTDRKVVIGADNGSIEISNGGNITFENDITGSGYLIKEGLGTIGIKSKAPQKGIIINNGAVQLASEEANINGPGSLVEFNNGALYMFDNSYSYNSNCSWSINVPEGKTGTLYADARSHLTGKLTGEGTFNFNTPWIRTELSGNWSAFSGRLNVMTSSNGVFLLNNTYGLRNADLNLGDDFLMIHE